MAIVQTRSNRVGCSDSENRQASLWVQRRTSEEAADDVPLSFAVSQPVPGGLRTLESDSCFLGSRLNPVRTMLAEYQEICSQQGTPAGTVGQWGTCGILIACRVPPLVLRSDSGPIDFGGCPTNRAHREKQATDSLGALPDRCWPGCVVGIAIRAMAK